MDAKIWGDPTDIFILGFANTSFIGALRDQLHLGDKAPEYMPGYGFTPKGREFTAFVIPDAAKSVERVLEKFEPIQVPL